MSAIGVRLGLVLVTIGAGAGCKDEPLTSTSTSDISEVSTFQASVSGSPIDRAAIQLIVTTFDQAWTAGDAVRYAGQYAGITDWVGPTGAVVTDPSALVGLYTFVLNVALPGTTRQSTIRSLLFLTGTIAVLDIDARVTGAFLPPAGLLAREKNILVKHASGWRILRHQQTLVTE